MGEPARLEEMRRTTEPPDVSSCFRRRATGAEPKVGVYEMNQQALR